MQHPDNQQLEFFVAGKLSAEEEKIVEEHLAQCSECMKVVSDFERKPQDPLMQKMQAVAVSDNDSSETAAYVGHLLQGSRPVSNLLMPGDVLSGSLQLEEKLGQGGMGEAWKAVDPLAERHVVLKFVPGEMQHIKAAMDSVRSSFQKIHALQHQHICPVYSLVDDPKHGIYIVMKYIDGPTLDEYRRLFEWKNSGMPFDDIILILRAVAEGLDYAHERRVIHRDIKPGNIMIGRKDGVQIIDFGLAEEIRTNMAKLSEMVMDVSGTRPYMAPEQWQGRTQDARTDQYALAVTAYELLAGHPPFSGNDIGILKNSVLNDSPEPISGMSGQINAALLKGLSKKREDRFPDCKSFVTALAEGAALLPSAKKTLEIGKRNRSKIAWLTALGIIVVCLLLFRLFDLFFAKSPLPETHVAATLDKSEDSQNITTEQTANPIAPLPRQHSWPGEQYLASSPAEFQKRLKEIDDEIKEKGGFAVAGQVFERNGSPMKKGTFTVALKYNESNAKDTYRFENGWFITRQQPGSEWDKLVVTTFQHDEVEMPLKIEFGKVNFQQVFLNTTPKLKQVAINGIVQDEKGRPVVDANVSVIISRSNGYFECRLTKNTVTDSKGRYSLSGMTPQEYSLNISSKQYSDSYAYFKVYPEDNKTTLVLKGYSNGLTREEKGGFVSTILFPKKVVIDTVYQPDGSTDFSKTNVLKSQYEMELFGNSDIAMGDQKIGGRIIFDPTAKQSRWGYFEDDLRLSVNEGRCSFDHFYVNDQVGHYDLGEVDFDSVKKADSAKIQRSDSSCELNHVYVVRTYDKGYYAKFVVRSIEIIE